MIIMSDVFAHSVAQCTLGLLPGFLSCCSICLLLELLLPRLESRSKLNFNGFAMLEQHQLGLGALLIGHILAKWTPKIIQRSVVYQRYNEPIKLGMTSGFLMAVHQHVHPKGRIYKTPNISSICIPAATRLLTAQIKTPFICV